VRFVRGDPAEEGWFIEEVKGLLAVLGKAVIEGGEQPPDHALA